MHEYITDAVVLDKEPNGDLDSRVYLFTERGGRVVAKVKSARKITSKLNPHLEPGTLTTVRITEKNGVHVTDAVKKRVVDAHPASLSTLRHLLADAQPDDALWRFLITPHTAEYFWRSVLPLLGWGTPDDAYCAACHSGTVTVFHMYDQQFLCSSCSTDIPKADSIPLK